MKDWIHDMFFGMGAATVFILIILFVIIGPFISIWAVNTLFELGIPYTFLTWVATVWFHMLISNAGSSTNKNGGQ